MQPITYRGPVQVVNANDIVLIDGIDIQYKNRLYPDYLSQHISLEEGEDGYLVIKNTEYEIVVESNVVTNIILYLNQPDSDYVYNLTNCSIILSYATSNEDPDGDRDYIKYTGDIEFDIEKQALKISNTNLDADTELWNLFNEMIGGNTYFLTSKPRFVIYATAIYLADTPQIINSFGKNGLQILNGEVNIVPDINAKNINAEDIDVNTVTIKPTASPNADNSGFDFYKDKDDPRIKINNSFYRSSELDGAEGWSSLTSDPNTINEYGERNRIGILENISNRLGTIESRLEELKNLGFKISDITAQFTNYGTKKIIVGYAALLGKICYGYFLDMPAIQNINPFTNSSDPTSFAATISLPFTPAENKQINFYVADSYSTTTLYLYSINIQMNNKQATMDYKETISLSDASIDIVNFNYVIDANFKISNPEAKNVHIDLTCNGLSTSEGEIYTEETDSLNIALARTITGYHLYIFSNLNMAKENIKKLHISCILNITTPEENRYIYQLSKTFNNENIISTLQNAVGEPFWYYYTDILLDDLNGIGTEGTDFKISIANNESYYEGVTYSYD